MRFTQGQRVNTPLGPGNVAYERLAPPDFIEAEAVSVLLDNRRDNPFYVGTTFAAYKVETLLADQYRASLTDPRRS